MGGMDDYDREFRYTAIKPFDREAHAGGCSYRAGHECDCTLKGETLYRRREV